MGFPHPHGHGTKHIGHRNPPQGVSRVFHQTSQKDDPLQVMLPHQLVRHRRIIMTIIDFPEHHGKIHFFQFILKEMIHALKEGVVDALAEKTDGVIFRQFQVSGGTVWYKMIFLHHRQNLFSGLTVDGGVVVDGPGNRAGTDAADLCDIFDGHASASTFAFFAAFSFASLVRITSEVRP